MEKVVKWKLQDGRTVTYTVELVTEKTVNLDGDISIIPCNEYREYVNVDDAGYYIDASIIVQDGIGKNGIPYAAIIGNKIAISQEIYGKISDAKKEVRDAIFQNSAKKKKNIVWWPQNGKGYCPKCKTYCYGDCES